MIPGPTHIAAPPGDLYWRRERCPHHGAKVLLLTIGGVCIVGQWYGDPGESFVAWCPLQKDGAPPANIREAPLLRRIVFALKLIFQPSKLP
jgi:hypothetical protein